jgi:hypothetical protein
MEEFWIPLRCRLALGGLRIATASLQVGSFATSSLEVGSYGPSLLRALLGRTPPEGRLLKVGF